MRPLLLAVAIWIYAGAFLGFILNCLIAEFSSGSLSPFDPHLSLCLAIFTLGIHPWKRWARVLAPPSPGCLTGPREGGASVRSQTLSKTRRLTMGAEGTRVRCRFATGLRPLTSLR
jgi:hypothetical protein